MMINYRQMFPLMLCGVAAVSTAESWHADPVSGCTVYDDEDSAESVLISWSGDCDKNNRASGSGVLTWIEDRKLAGRYEGAMKAGKADGNGVIYVLADVGGYDRYEGLFKNRELAGRTKAKGADGGSFEGTFNAVDL